jgi:uncharacterized membrane protein YphA (DoxX/SURF4 family)
MPNQMSVLEGPFAATCVLLALAGASKVARPAPTVGALRAVRWPASMALVRVLGVFEIVAGVVAVISGRPLAAFVVAALHVAFAVFVIVALRAGSPVQSCGCFGETETPPSLAHLVTDLVLAGAAFVVAFGGGLPSLGDTLRDQPMAAVPFVVLVAVAVQLLLVVLTDLPRALGSVRS